MNLQKFSVSQTPPNARTVLERLDFWTETRPEAPAYCFTDGEADVELLTYGELSRKSKAIAADLQSRGMTGERALLLYPPGLDFVAGFFGCLYAGVTAVPAYPPRRNRNMLRIQDISENASAKAALTVDDVVMRIWDSLDDTPHLKNLNWVATDKINPDESDAFKKVKVSENDLAILQYLQWFECRQL